jgi:photosystem II stability/assembly factor-like uncharacterized protein
MRKMVFVAFLAVAVPMLSGCALPSLPGGIGATSSVSAGPSMSFARSTDGGVTFESKTKLDEKIDFSDADITVMAVSPNDTRRFFLGTKASGVFATTDSGDTWRKINYPPTKVYGLVIDLRDEKQLFATGEWQGRGKIYRSRDAGENWEEVYTEPSGKTTLTALAQDPFHTDALYAGTSAGMIIRSNDGGQTWKNITFAQAMAGKIIWNIAFDPRASDKMYLMVDGMGVFVADGSKILETPSGSSGALFGGAQDAGKPSKGGISGLSGTISFAVDPNRAGVFYAGTARGVFRTGNYGKEWEALNVIESSRKFPVRALAVNPKNSDEIVYVAAQTLYKSVDGGAHWSTHSVASDKAASFIRYDSYNPSILYVGFKK